MYLCFLSLNCDIIDTFPYLILFHTTRAPGSLYHFVTIFFSFFSSPASTMLLPSFTLHWLQTKNQIYSDCPCFVATYYLYLSNPCFIAYYNYSLIIHASLFSYLFSSQHFCFTASCSMQFKFYFIFS